MRTNSFSHRWKGTSLTDFYCIVCYVLEQEANNILLGDFKLLEEEEEIDADDEDEVNNLNNNDFGRLFKFSAIQKALVEFRI